MKMKYIVVNRLADAMETLGRLKAEVGMVEAEAAAMRSQVAKLNHEKAEQIKATQAAMARLEGELDAAENMLVRMEEERDDLAFRLEECHGE
jgi:chromosome segregation ATPase